MCHGKAVMDLTLTLLLRFKMNTRFFALGCSFCRNIWAAVPDLIAGNYDEYYNYGSSGASNSMTMRRFLDCDIKFKLNPETDFVLIMVTGIGRFEYLKTDPGKDPYWLSKGDIEQWVLMRDDKDPDYPVLKSFVDTMWNSDWAVDRTWTSIKVIKSLLDAKRIPYKIIPSMDNSYYRQENIDTSSLKLIDDLFDMMDVKVSIREHQLAEGDKPLYFPLEKYRDGHPSPKVCLSYIEQYLPEFYTDNALKIFKEYEDIFDPESVLKTGSGFGDYLNKRFNARVRQI